MKQSEVSKESLTRALLSLMEEKDYSEITVKEIAKKAGMSRQTFYRYYETKEQVLLYYIDKSFEEYLSLLGVIKSPDLFDAVILCFRFWESKADWVCMLSRHGIVHLILKPFEECMVKLFDELGTGLQFSEGQKKFLIGGLYLTMLSWVGTDRRMSPEQVSNELVEVFNREAASATLKRK